MNLIREVATNQILGPGRSLICLEGKWRPRPSLAWPPLSLPLSAKKLVAEFAPFKSISQNKFASFVLCDVLLNAAE